MKYDYPTIVIGAGAGGLVVAIGTAKAGRKVLLIEKGLYGGDCTNFGCIPSKSLIASAHYAHALRIAPQYGIQYQIKNFNADQTLARTRHIVETIRKTEEPAPLLKHGVETLSGEASFLDPHKLQITLHDGSVKTVTGDQIVIATGSSPLVPSIPGLDRVRYHTNETIFDLKQIPESLVIIGGGAIGCELAQSFSRLGTHVSIVEEMPHLMHSEDPKAREVIETQFREEGINLFLHHKAVQVGQREKFITLEIKQKDHNETKILETTDLLTAVGRRPNTSSLHLEAASIKSNERGIIIDKYGRASQKNIWAVGDVVGRGQFTHIAENEARTVLRNLLLPWPFRFKIDEKQAIPRVTYTDPEIANIGLNQEQAIEKYGKRKIITYEIPFSDLDRAITESRSEGHVKVITKKWSSKILGAVIVGPRAGEMLQEISIAMRHGITLRKLGSLIHPYPTYSLAIRKCADQWFTKTVIPFFSRKTKQDQQEDKC